MDYRVISTADHLQEKPDTYTSRMTKKWGNKIPTLRRNPDGTESWVVGDEPKGLAGAVALVHGVMPDRATPPSRWADVPAKAYVAAERVKAMDEDGVDVHTFFG